MKRWLPLVVGMTLLVGVVGAPAASALPTESEEDGGTYLTLTQRVGAVELSWRQDAEEAAAVTKFELVRETCVNYSDCVKKTLYTGLDTSYVDVEPIWYGESATYSLSAYFGEGGVDRPSIEVEGQALRDLKLTQGDVRLNIGDSYSLAIVEAATPSFELQGWELGDGLLAYGVWSTSDSAVATVSAKGKVKAVGGGDATITFTSWSGATASKPVAVASAFDVNYSVRASLDPVLKQLKGRPNVVTGTIVSSLPIKKIVIRVLKGSKVEKSYSKKVVGGPKKYDLSAVKYKFPFDKLSKGKKTLKVYVVNSKGTALAHTANFSVVNSIPKGERAALAAEWALRRIGDKYSQSKRMKLGYADCSSLVYWAYKQVGVDLPASSKSQAKWVKSKKKAVKLSKKQLASGEKFKPGDLLFYDYPKGRANLKYVNHVDIYVGGGMIVTASSGFNQVVLAWYGYNGAAIEVGRLA
ncbi:MAG: C40 family peptidase [Propionibacteriaceae bacterium]|jgi:cell wall-associated NlpC family hydrolase|nr:C40 family peptidase [Propionibacteriaceae bacterium]